MNKGFKQPKIEIAPELQFISKETIAAVDGAEEAKVEAPIPKGKEKPPEGYKLNPMYIEVKSKRVQLVLQPSLYTKVKAAADAAGISFNEFCHSLLEEATRED